LWKKYAAQRKEKVSLEGFSSKVSNLTLAIGKFGTIADPESREPHYLKRNPEG